MEQENNYHISFFRPTTQRAKANRNMVLWLISIWAIAVFGFQFLLRAIEEPTPEPQLIEFNEVWSNVKTDMASVQELQQFTKAILHVNGKVFITNDERRALQNGITWAVFRIVDSIQSKALLSSLKHFEGIVAKDIVFTENAYLLAKQELGGLTQVIVSIDHSSVLNSILPLELKSEFISTFSEDSKSKIEACMPKYLIHNRSVLTDTQFLGFPFHYFYTAVFLLILFIGLCYAYCVLTDRANKKLQIAE